MALVGRSLLRAVRAREIAPSISARRFGSAGEDALREFDLLAEASSEGKLTIEGFASDGFLINDTYYYGACVLFPKEVFLWNVTTPADISSKSLALVTCAIPQIDHLIIGTGAHSAMLPREFFAALKAHGVMAEAMNTRNAIGTFNVLNQEDRRVAAALLPMEPYDRIERERDNSYR